MKGRRGSTGASRFAHRSPYRSLRLALTPYVVHRSLLLSTHLATRREALRAGGEESGEEDVSVVNGKGTEPPCRRSFHSLRHVISFLSSFTSPYSPYSRRAGLRPGLWPELDG